VIALDAFTLAVLARHVEMLDRERAEFGPGYHDYGLLFCWEDGRPPHPDTITRRFHKLAEAAGLPKINLHDVRHSYATAGRDAEIDWKALSSRIGHAMSRPPCGNMSRVTWRWIARCRRLSLS
jgi:integrase